MISDMHMIGINLYNTQFILNYFIIFNYDIIFYILKNGPLAPFILKKVCRIVLETNIIFYI